MSTTDEMREWTKGFMLAVADRIDAEYEEAIQQVLMGEGGVPATDENMDEHGWVRLPKDADGEYIRIGDELDYLEALHPDVPSRFKVQDMFYYGNGKWHLRAYPATYEPEKCRHYHAPTVEDVLEELLREYDRDDSELTNGEIVEMFAKRLQLREDA